MPATQGGKEGRCRQEGPRARSCGVFYANTTVPVAVAVGDRVVRVVNLPEEIGLNVRSFFLCCYHVFASRIFLVF